MKTRRLLLEVSARRRGAHVHGVTIVAEDVPEDFAIKIVERLGARLYDLWREEFDKEKTAAELTKLHVLSPDEDNDAQHYNDIAPA